MSLPGSGCCCGIVAGIVVSIITAVIGTIAVYCWFNPEARKSGVAVVEKQWESFKDFGDEVIDNVKEKEPPRIPEPKIEIDFD
ncbi:MAG: hypothetical protein IKC65_06405 [Lentisphaeria bacterium]|nr:hypothetical protein [Lentisphaeria bacterium]